MTDYFDNISHTYFTRILESSSGEILKSLELLRNEISYQPSSSWTLPQTTLKLKQGDCKSFAFLSAYYLHWLKIPFQIFTQLNLQEKINGHVYILFFFNDHLYFLDNDSGPTSLDGDELNLKNQLEIFSNLK